MKEYKVFCIIFAVLALGLAGYICYDKMSNKKVCSCPSCQKAEGCSKCKCPSVDTKEKECNCPLCEDRECVSMCPTCTATGMKDINTDQHIKMHIYASNYGETAYHRGRFVLTLFQNDGNNAGFFDIDSSFGLEGGYHAGGFYRIKDGKIEFSTLVGDDADAFEKELGATLSLDPDRNDGRIYTTNYNADELKIGVVTFYIVNR